MVKASIIIFLWSKARLSLNISPNFKQSTSSASVSAFKFPPVFCAVKHIVIICPRGSLSGSE
jgi:hypothetical protein